MTEQDNILRKRFFAFLKENNAYDKWLYNLRKRHPSNEIWWWNDFYQTLYEDRCLRAIICAFSWSYTVEGFQFWYNLSNEWSDYRIETMKTGFYD